VFELARMNITGVSLRSTRIGSEIRNLATSRLSLIAPGWESPGPTGQELNRGLSNDQRPLPSLTATSLKIGNRRGSPVDRASAQVAEFEERPLRGAIFVCKLG
jgi:hypothetical protein